MASEKITAIIEELKGLTVLELSELVHAVEDEFGVSAAAAVAVAGPAADGAAAAAEQTGAQTHVVEEGIGVLLVEARLSGLPAEAANHGLPAGLVEDPVRAAGDAVAVAVIGVGIGQQRLFGNGFEQAQADHRWRDA